MSNLAQRAITALFGAALMIAAYVINQWSFGVVTLLLLTFILHEFYSLAKKNGYHPFSFWGLAFGVIMFSMVFLMSTGLIEPKWLWLLPAILAACFIFPLYASTKVHPINCLAVTLMGIVYVALPMTLLSIIAFRDGTYDFTIILALLLAQWANDTGGYFAGKTLGKTKLFEKVSPNKTWEGSVGGAILTMALMYGWSQFFDNLTLIEWAGLGLVVVVFGSLGDLVESLFKRTFDIKDSGTILKGHGGFLDRFDGLIMAIPFATVYVMLVI